MAEPSRLVAVEPPAEPSGRQAQIDAVLESALANWEALDELQAAEAFRAVVYFASWTDISRFRKMAIPDIHAKLSADLVRMQGSAHWAEIRREMIAIGVYNAYRDSTYPRRMHKYISDHDVIASAL